MSDIVLNMNDSQNLKEEEIREKKLEDNKRLIDEINEKLENLPPVVKKTKSGAEKLLDISPMVFAARASESDCKVSLELTLSSSGDAYLNPELVIQSLALSDTDYSITRTHINFSAE